MEYPNDWDRKVFQSSWVHSAQYSLSRRTLSIAYGRQATSVAYQVPPNIWEGLKKAPSPGSFIRNIIHPSFFGKKEHEHKHNKV